MVVIFLVIIRGTGASHSNIIDVCELLSVFVVDIRDVHISASGDIDHDVGVAPSGGAAVIGDDGAGRFQLRNVLILDVDALLILCPLLRCQGEYYLFRRECAAGIRECGSVAADGERARRLLAAQLLAVLLEQCELVCHGEVRRLEELVFRILIRAVFPVIRGGVVHVHAVADPEDLSVVCVQLAHRPVVDDEMGIAAVSQQAFQWFVGVKVAFAHFIVPADVRRQIGAAAYGNTSLCIGIMGFEIVFQKYAEL